MTTAAQTTVVATVPARRTKTGIWSSLTSVTGSVASVIENLADVGSEATIGLKHQATGYRLGTARDLIEEFGTIEAIRELDALSKELSRKL